MQMLCKGTITNRWNKNKNTLHVIAPYWRLNAGLIVSQRQPIRWFVSLLCLCYLYSAAIFPSSSLSSSSHTTHATQRKFNSKNRLQHMQRVHSVYYYNFFWNRVHYSKHWNWTHSDYKLRDARPSTRNTINIFASNWKHL